MRQRDFGFSVIALLPGKLVVSFVDIWTVWHRGRLSGTLWIVAECGKVMRIPMRGGGGDPDQRLLGKTQPAKPAPPGTSGITAMEVLLQN